MTEPPVVPSPDGSAADVHPETQSEVAAEVANEVQAEVQAEVHAEVQAEQRASWLELFFDLVVVVAVALLADRVKEHPDWQHVGLVVLLYLAIWLVWVQFMLYANVAGDRTHQRSMIIAMGCIAVMAAAIPGVASEGDDRARSFAIAFVVARFLGMQTFRTTQQAMVDWPIAQISVGLAPWVASIFVHEPWRYVLWIIGLGLDIGFSLMADDPKRILAMLRDEKHGQSRAERSGQRAARRESRREQGRDRLAREDITAARLNLSHFEERLGVFLIIVLGEAVAQIVIGAAGRPLNDGNLGRAAGASFVVLVGLWWLTFQYGFASSPESRLAKIPARYGLPLHFLTTASIVFLAAGLGECVLEPAAALPDPARWLGAAGLAAYFVLGAVGGMAAGAGVKWLAVWALPSCLGALAIGAFGGALAGWGIAALLLVPVAWQVSYGWLVTRGERVGVVDRAANAGGTP